MSPHKCANPECSNVIEDDNKKFCSPDCHKKFRELKGIPEKVNVDFTIDEDVEKALSYMGINKSTYGKPYAYKNWETLLLFIKKCNGMEWKIVEPRLRTILGMQHRYIYEYVESLYAWGIIYSNNGNIYYKGVPEKEVK